MTDPYSPLLLTAMTCLAAAAVARLLARRSEPLRRWARWLAYAALAAAAAAAAFHLAVGHHPGSPAAMPAGELLAAHPAPIATVVAALLLAVLSRDRSR